MTLLEGDLAIWRRGAALAADHPTKLLVLAEEVDRLTREDQRLAETCGLGPADAAAFRYEGFEKLLAVFRDGVDGATTVGNQVLPSLDELLVVSLLERETNRRVLEDVCRERDELTATRREALETVEHFRKLAADWVGAISKWDPGLGSHLQELEVREGHALRAAKRLEDAQVAALDAEKSLEGLGNVFHEALDWVAVNPADESSYRPVLRVERLRSADHWIFDAQLSLARVRRWLMGTDYLASGTFQVDLLSRFAATCFANLGRDLASRDGLPRAARAVSWTMTTVRALRGYLVRSQNDLVRSLEDLRRRRTKSLSGSPS